MKKTLLKKSTWQSILSVLALGIFAWLAMSTLPAGVNQQTVYLGNGVYETAKTYGPDKTEVFTGKYDDYDRWHGVTKIETTSGSDFVSSERVTMVAGKRHGRSTITYSDGKTEYFCYNMGERVSCEKAAVIGGDDDSAFENLNYKYPWFLNTLNLLGFNNEYVEAYIDTLESVLYSYDFDEDEFDDFYEDAIEVLEETPYDSIVSSNYILMLYLALENMKNSEFRMATIDHFRSDNIGTYDILQTKFPGYIQYIDEAEVTSEDFEIFCSKFDSILASYGALDLEDPFFADSADTRMYEALNSISSTEKSALTVSALKSTIKESEISNLINNKNVRQLLLDSSPQNIATLIQVTILLRYYITQDLIRDAVRDSYVTKNGVIILPTVTTELSGYNSSTSATVWGHVITDGNNSVTTKGIVWANFYNPTINDNLETRGNGTLPFSATLEGLTEGETYYARAFATNNAGTAYGNCISFTAGNTVGIDDNKFTDSDFTIYPNPVSSTATFSFQIKQTESLVLTIIDLNGKVIIEEELGNLSIGKNEVQLNLSNFQNGIYNCLLTNNSTIKVNKKLLIAH